MVPGTWVLEYRVLPRTAADSAATRARGRRGLQNVQNDVMQTGATTSPTDAPRADAASRARDNHVQIINIDVTLQSTVTAEPHAMRMCSSSCIEEEFQ